MLFKAIFAALCFLLFSVSTLAAAPQIEGHYGQNPAYHLFYEKPKGASMLVAPTAVHLEEKSKRLFIYLRINGKGPYKFLVDTGMGFSAINDEVARELHLPLAFEGGFYMNNELKKVRFHRAAKIVIGDATLMDYDFILASNAPAIAQIKKTEKLKFDGMIGYGAFYHYLMSLDFKNHKLILASADLKGDKKATKYIDDAKVPVLRVEFSDENDASLTVLAMLDTGFDGQFILPPNVNGIPFKTSKSEETTLYGFENSRTVTAKIKGQAVVANQVFDNPEITYRPTKPNESIPIGILGFELLKDYRLSFDQKNAFVKIERA